MLFEIQAVMCGFITIEAETSEEALEIAEAMGSDDFEWANVEITSCQES